ncbi:hypothetical protein [Bradyrhizobium sp. SZCCHNR1093]|uniref:hypothetical protein n=1 Tax=Bradyrhizobium sp. SZCCHNR1093 TaxID=3057368 RepID=UPI0028E529D1|nr:hypothetical protein [Bradyrhizobium sp. SZCCHNR1093]
MIWTGIQWILRSRKAPWSVVPVSATISPHILPWYAVRFFSRSDRPFAVELLTVRTIRPKSLQLCAADPAVQLGIPTNTGANQIADLKWLIEENNISQNRPFQRHLFVNLAGLKGDVAVDFEFTASFYDNQRTKALIWVRTNPLTLAATS